MTLGVTTGKFYPFHLGHDYLIRQAKSQVDHLVVLLGYKPGQEIPVEVREQWLRQMHPDIEIICALEDIANAPEPWAKRTLELLSPRVPDVVFTSEDYGEKWAELMGCSHVMVDKPRGVFPISASKIREDMATHWDMLAPPTKAYFCKRVCCLGVESSGTTTLAQSLAEHFQTVWVPEYGRWYWEGRRYLAAMEDWDTYEFELIARGQIRWEDDLAMRANKVLIADTDALTTHVWHRRYVGEYAPSVGAIADQRDYDLYILTEPDFPFVQDGTREGEHIRMAMHGWFEEVLRERQKKYINVHDSHEKRKEKSVQEIESMLVFKVILPP